MKTSTSIDLTTAVSIRCGRLVIQGDLAIPEVPLGLVIFSHATNGGWSAPRNWPIAWALHQGGYATLLLNLLDQGETHLEHAKGLLIAEVPLLAQRLVTATRWALGQESLQGLDYAYFGSEGAAAAAIEAAAVLPGCGTVIGRAARTDLLSQESERIDFPILLIVGENDRRTLRWNQAFASSRPRTKLEVIGGAGHAFREPGALQHIANLTREWLPLHLLNEREGAEESWTCC